MIKLNQSGFTLKELLIVFIVIGILCAGSIPLFHKLQKDMHLRRVQKTVTRVQKAIHKYTAPDTKQYPATLDISPVNEVCNGCFNLVLTRGLIDKGWFKLSNEEYLYSPLSTDKLDEVLKHPHQFRILYNNKTGTLSFVEMK